VNRFCELCKLHVSRDTTPAFTTSLLSTCYLFIDYVTEVRPLLQADVTTGTLYRFCKHNNE